MENEEKSEFQIKINRSFAFRMVLSLLVIGLIGANVYFIYRINDTTTTTLIGVEGIINYINNGVKAPQQQAPVTPPPAEVPKK